MLVTVIDEMQNIFSYEMSGFQSLGDLKDCFTAQTNRPKAEYQFLYKNRTMISDAPTFSSLEYNGDDVFIVRKKQNMTFGNGMAQQQAQQQAQPQYQPQYQSQAMGNTIEMMVQTPQMQMQIQNEATQMKSYYTSNPYELNNIMERDPELGEALLCDDNNFLITHLTKKKVEQLRTKQKEQDHLNTLNSDQFNVEYQREIEKKIAEERHDAALNKIYDEMPGLLVPTTMLYVPMKIKGQDVQAFIDTGAQSTIMSYSYANGLGITKLIDTRYKGKAVGVGSCNIIGKIHALRISIGAESEITCSIQILDNDNMDFLFGLDNMKRHRCCVDLLNNELKFNELVVSVPF